MPFTSPTSCMQRIIMGPIDPAVLFLSLTSPEITPAFFARCSFRCENPEQPNAPYALVVGGDYVLADGIILEYEPPYTMLMTFAQHWYEEINDPPGRVRFTVTERSPNCEFTIVHDGLTAGSRLNDDLDDAWLMVASGLKTLVEVARAMPLRQDEVEAVEAGASSPEPEPASAAAGP